MLISSTVVKCKSLLTYQYLFKKKNQPRKLGLKAFRATNIEITAENGNTDDVRDVIYRVQWDENTQILYNSEWL